MERTINWEGTDEKRGGGGYILMWATHAVRKSIHQKTDHPSSSRRTDALPTYPLAEPLVPPISYAVVLWPTTLLRPLFSLHARPPLVLPVLAHPRCTSRIYRIPRHLPASLVPRADLCPVPFTFSVWRCLVRYFGNLAFTGTLFLSRKVLTNGSG